MIRLQKQLSILAAAACLAVTGGCSTGLSDLAPVESTGAVEVSLAPGDKVEISIQDLEAVSGEYIIDEAGSLSLPLIDRVELAGLSYTEAQNVIAAKLVAAEVLKKPNVTVQPLELRPIYILGEVRQPGEYAYRQGLTVFAAVSMAGGYTYRAKTDKVEVTRIIDGQSTKGLAKEDSVILPGDRIRVYERWF